MASENGHFDAVCDLIERDKLLNYTVVDVNTIDVNGPKSLNMANVVCLCDVVRELLGREKLDANVMDEYGNTISVLCFVSG